jgi:hypothetical protein
MQNFDYFDPRLPRHVPQILTITDFGRCFQPGTGELRPYPLPAPGHSAAPPQGCFRHVPPHVLYAGSPRLVPRRRPPRPLTRSRRAARPKHPGARPAAPAPAGAASSSVRPASVGGQPDADADYRWSTAYSAADGSARGSVLGEGRVASQPRQASQIALGICFCAVR